MPHTSQIQDTVNLNGKRSKLSRPTFSTASVKSGGRSMSAIGPLMLDEQIPVSEAGRSVQCHTRPFNLAFRIRFSAARYSFRASSSWSTVPVT